MSSSKRILISGIFVLLFGSAIGDHHLKASLTPVKSWEGTGDMSNMFRGTAGVDYPDLKTIPNTSFRCEDQQYDGGLYADVETRCQVYHVCHDGRKNSFMCGRGTVFNQQILACDYWYSTECDNAPSYYYVNSQIEGTNSKWVPQPNSNSNNPQTNYQGTGPNAGNYGQDGNYGSHNSNNGYAGNPDSNQGNGQQSCCCLKNTYKAPWNFPINSSK